MIPQVFDCQCSVCDREYVAWMEYMRDLDRLAMADPDQDAQYDFALWVMSEDAGRAR